MVVGRDYILGIDVGVASLGVALLDVDERGHPTGVRRASAFIYPSGGDETAERRKARAVRKGYERRRKRLKAVRVLLSNILGAVPGFDTDLTRSPDGRTATSRVGLRARGLDEPLSADDLARAVMHIARNRGMRLTRVMGDDDDSRRAAEELGQMAGESRATRARMETVGAPTPGAFLHAAECEAEADHKRPPIRRRRGGTAMHRFLRRQVEEELRRLLDAQAPYHAGLTPEAREALFDAVFEEQPLKPPPVGPCRYFPDEERMRVASDLYQTKRIYEEVNNIRIRYNDGSAEKLSLAQRDDLVASLLAGETLTPAQIKKRLRLKQGAISLDDRRGSDGRSLKGHAVQAAVAGTPLHPLYDDPANRDTLDTLLREEKDQERLVNRLMAEYGVDEDVAWNLAAEIHLPSATAPMGRTAAARILEHLRADVISHTETVERAGLIEPDAEGRLRDRLPYYGEVFPHLVRRVPVADGVPGFGHPAAPLEIKYGRIPNPVVHKAFNALRKVVNTILKEEGPPLRVQIELARDMKKTQEEREDAQKKINRDRRKNEDYDAITLAHGKRPSRKNRRRLRLAELQNWVCPYSNRTIEYGALFDGTFDLDHILPRAKTLDDGLGNLVVALEHANKLKGDRSPYEAFAGGYTDPDGEHHEWEKIVARVRKFKDARRRQRRFSPEAMQRFEDQDAFRQRFETDTSYIAKWAAQYMRLICPDVRVVNGHIVSEVRHQWGLSTLVAQIQAEEDGRTPEEIVAEQDQVSEDARKRRKSRADHRHHILDALVTAAIPLNVVQQLQTAAGRGFRRGDGPAIRLPGAFNPRPEAARALRKARAVHRVDHEVNKRLHLEMAWGVLARFGDGTYLARRRARLSGEALHAVKDLDKLLVPEELMQRFAADLDEGGLKMYWEAQDPVAALRAIAEDQAAVRERIRALYEVEPAKEEVLTTDGSAVRVRTRPEAERLARALEVFRAETGRRSALVFARRALVLMGEADGQRPKLAYETMGNAWLDIRRDGNGRLTWEAVPRIAARTAAVKDVEPPVLRIFAGDTLEVTDGAGERRLCRVMSASTGDVQLLPVNDARPAKESPNRNAFRYTSLSRFVAADPVPVVCDPLGRIRWRGPRRNW